MQGTVDFIHEPDQTKYQVDAGSSSIVADAKQVTSGPGREAAAWAEWNTTRDGLWAKRTEVKGESVKYLPSELQHDAYDLDRGGRWERVNYEGRDYQAWTPVGVDSDWAPYTVGRWTDYYGDNAWIPDEPFGYVTMHYGNWLWANGGWCWVPPAVGVGVTVGWFPGRVGWLYSNADVGWFPLAIGEPYYSHHRWGGGAVVVNNVTINNFNRRVDNYRFAGRAVVVPRNTLYSANSYRGVRLRNSRRTDNRLQFSRCSGPERQGSAESFRQQAEIRLHEPCADNQARSCCRDANRTQYQDRRAGFHRESPDDSTHRGEGQTREDLTETASIAPPTIRNKPVNPRFDQGRGSACRALKGQCGKEGRGNLLRRPRAVLPEELRRGPCSRAEGATMIRPATPPPPTKEQVGKATQPNSRQRMARPGGTTPGRQPQRQAVVPKPQAAPPRQQATAPRPQPHPQAAAPRPQPQPQRQAVAPRPQAAPPRQQATAPRPQPHPQAAAPRPQPQRQAIAPRPQPPPQRQAVAPETSSGAAKAAGDSTSSTTSSTGSGTKAATAEAGHSATTANTDPPTPSRGPETSSGAAKAAGDSTSSSTAPASCGSKAAATSSESGGGTSGQEVSPQRTLLACCSILGGLAEQSRPCRPLRMAWWKIWVKLS